jgi:ABC-type lipoprotein export system ATPase subunit
MATLIKLNNIERYYKNKLERTYVLRNINLEVNEGEFISIMGPSGSGKSTLLYILGMLDTASGGEYYFLDDPVHEMNEKRLSELHKAYIGFVFQQYHLIDDLTVYENLETPLLYQKIKGDE